MRKFVLVALLGCVAVRPAAAQTKITGSQNCAKSDPTYMLDVGDQTGHSILLQKTVCSWENPIEIESLKGKDALDVSAVDLRGARASYSGYNTTTMDNGDKFTVHYSGPAQAAKDGSMSFQGTWTFVSGTGKLKGIRGSGTFKGTENVDGTGAVQIEGEYTLPPAVPTRPRRPATPAR